MTSLSLRNKMKSKKPEFEMQNVNVYPQNKGRWRKPRGLHSKMRNAFRGNPGMPSIGWGSPKDVRGLTREGYVPVVVNNAKQLEGLTKNNAILLSSTLGLKKRVELLIKIKEKNIRVLNIKEINKYIEEVKNRLESKKSESKKVQEKKSKMKEEAEKKSAKAEESKNEPKK